MKQTTIALLILAFAVSVHAEPDRYIKPDPWEANTYQIYNRDGKQTGTIKRDHWEPDKWNVDRAGKHTKTIKQDPWESNTHQILNRSGEQIGTIKQDRWTNDWLIYDRSGKHTGTVKQDVWENDRLNIEKRDP